MQIGDVFDKRYLILRILGQGGMGTVYLAKNINTDTYWAIKEIQKKEHSEIELPAEPKLLKRLVHPALPRLFDILEQDGKLYMVSDYINGISLDKKIEEEGKIGEETVVNWAIQLCKALDYLHSQKPNSIIYRDMKPSNIILSADGTLKLVDFGIAREFKQQSAGDTVYIGTRGYAAPEQYGTGQTSAASDIYSLGVTMHQLLTGKSPFEPPFVLKPVRYFDTSLSPGIEGIILKCTTQNINDRYKSASELLRALEVLQNKIKNPVPGNSSTDSKAENSSIKNPGERNVLGDNGFFFRKLIITIWNNAEFGCELAYMAARHTRGEVLLADLDLLAPKVDVFLNIKKYPGKAEHEGIYGHSGLDIVLDAIEKGSLTAELLQQAAIERKDLKNLHVLTGNYHMDNYEYFNEESVVKLIDKCYRTYDITIIIVNKSIYDAFTLASLLKSDINIAAVRGDIDVLREFNTFIAFLKDKQNLSLESTKFVLYEYDRGTCMSINEVRECTGDNLLGKISPSRRRAMYRNLKGAYAVRMEKEIESEYMQLLTKLELMPAHRPFVRIGKLARSYIENKLHIRGRQQRTAEYRAVD